MDTQRTTLKLKAWDGRFVAKEVKPGERKTAGGIILSNTIMPEFGNDVKAFDVVSVGKALDDNQYKHSLPEKGDTVMMAPFAGRSILIDNEEYRICTPDLIYAKVEGIVTQLEAEALDGSK